MRLAGHVNLSEPGYTVDRGGTFLLDLARMCAARDDHAGTLHNLRRLEEYAPQDIHHRPVARALVRALGMTAPPVYARDARRLAKRNGVRV